jgi:pimeloyl-ACP methyl ester carboxylesterase
VWTWGAAALVLLTGIPAAAQSKGQTQTLRAATDGWPLQITYLPATEGKDSGSLQDAPVIILLHGMKGDRTVWERKLGTQEGGLAALLNSRGFAVVTLDLRHHGESRKPGTDSEDPVLRNEDFMNMVVGDLEAVKEFLLKEHQDKKLNVNKLAIVAAEEMSVVAAGFAEFDWKKRPFDDAPSAAARTPRGQDVRVIVLLSPSRTAGNINLTVPMRFLKDPRVGVAVLIVAGKQDERDRGAARSAFQVVSTAKDAKDPAALTNQVAYLELSTKFRGTDLLGNPQIRVEAPLVQFVESHMQLINSPWRDRRSRLERDR